MDGYNGSDDILEKLKFATEEINDLYWGDVMQLLNEAKEYITNQRAQSISNVIEQRKRDIRNIRHVHYRSEDDKYRDHGRMIYDKIPNPGDIIEPFSGVRYKVIETKIQDKILVIRVIDYKSRFELEDEAEKAYIAEISKADYC